MIKLPEPEIALAWSSWSENWELRDLKHCLASKLDNRIIGYTEAQFRQFRSDAYEDAAKVCEVQEEYGPRNTTIWDCADAIRALIKEVDA